MINKLKCSELEQWREIVFKIDIFQNEEKQYWIGNVIYVDQKAKTVCISYLEGYKSRVDVIPFKDCVAAYDRDGTMMEFDNIKGTSILLEAD